MKTFVLLTLLFFTLSIKAQRPPEPLPPNAFNKMIVNDITYAIIGEATPLSGIKVDVSKPEATISGLFKPKKEKLPWDLFSFDFKGGVSDRNFSIFSGFNSFNTAFEFKPSFHFIPYCSSAKYGDSATAYSNSLIVNAKNRIITNNAAALRDTIIAISILREHHLAAANVYTDLDVPLPLPTCLNYNEEATLIYFIKKITNNQGLVIASGTPLATILSYFPVVTLKTETDQNGKSIRVIDNSNYKDEVDEIYRKYKKLWKNIEEYKLTKIINNASEVWTKKTYHWFTVSPFARTEKVNEFYNKFEGRDSFYFKAGYRFYYGIAGNYNYYVVYPDKRAHLLRVGITLSHSNNLSTLTARNYETRSPFFNYGTVVTEKTKSGSYYNHNDIKKGMVSQLNFEYYRLPLKSLIPGVYVSGNYNYSKLYELADVVGREKDKAQVGVEGGFVLNINSREKDKEKSIISLLLYFRHQDITDKRRTSIQTGLEESEDDFRKRNISLGIRVGIPINLPQRTD